jgi:hypothetical protein
LKLPAEGVQPMTKTPKRTEEKGDVKTTFLVPDAIYRRLAAIRAERRTTLQALFIEALEFWLSKQK